jgi:ribose/xylose/arabinose/galactoside ABC-type transport system permease subunit
MTRITPDATRWSSALVATVSAATQHIGRRVFSSVQRMTMLFFVLFFLCSLLFVDKFANLVNLTNMLVQCTDLIILSCGMTFVFMNGGIDFSVTAILGLSSVLGAKVMTMGGNPAMLAILGVTVMLVVGIAIGVLNGLAITQLRMPSFIATIATQLIFSGLALWSTQSATIGNLPGPFLSIGRGTLFGIQVPIFICIIVVAATAFVLHRTVLGRYMFALGTNHRTSRISGIPVKKTIFTLFLFSGGLAAVSAIIMTSRSAAGMPAVGKGMLMDIVAAVVIGGTSITGGMGSILGTVTGAALIVVLNNSLNLLGIEWYVINVVKGAMILVVALLGVLRTAER